MYTSVKKVLAAAVIVLAAAAAVSAQQITKFGVVDTAKVYQSYFRNSAPVRNYESKKTEFQDEINKRTAELQQLQQQKLQYEKDGNESAALRVQSDITKKSDYLTEYTNAKNVELESLKKNLQNSDAFYKKLYTVLAKVAEAGGYSCILSLQQDNAILWYSPSVDVTDDVIRELGQQ